MILTNKFVDKSKLEERTKHAYSILGGYEPLLEFSHLKKQTLTKTNNGKMRYHCHKLANDKDRLGYHIPLYGFRYKDDYDDFYGQIIEEYLSDADITSSGRRIGYGDVAQSVNKFNQGIKTIYI